MQTLLGKFNKVTRDKLLIALKFLVEKLHGFLLRGFLVDLGQFSGAAAQQLGRHVEETAVDCSRVMQSVVQ